MDASWQDPPEYRDGGGSQFAMPRLTPAVRMLISVNAAVFVLGFVLSFAANGAWSNALTRWFGISPGLWTEGFPFVPVWQLVTWGFLHSVNQAGHILFNMLALYFFGTMLEEAVGTRRFTVMYFSALVISGIVTLAAGLVVGPTELVDATGAVASIEYPPTVGASGAVLCVVVAMAVLRPATRVIFILFPVTLRTLALIIVGIDAFRMLLQLRDGSSSGVSHTAHLSGAAWGFAAVKLGWIWKDPLAEVEVWRDRNQAKKVVEDKERLDDLLHKINREGIHALSPREKAFLKRASKRS